MAQVDISSSAAGNIFCSLDHDMIHFSSPQLSVPPPRAPVLPLRSTLLPPAGVPPIPFPAREPPVAHPPPVGRYGNYAAYATASGAPDPSGVPPPPLPAHLAGTSASSSDPAPPPPPVVGFTTQVGHVPHCLLSDCPVFTAYSQKPPSQRNLAEQARLLRDAHHPTGWASASSIRVGTYVAVSPLVPGSPPFHR